MAFCFIMLFCYCRVVATDGEEVLGFDGVLGTMIEDLKIGSLMARF